jgi:hypothetical protein
MHGGAKAKIPPGDPRRGGAAVTTGIYSKYLRPDTPVTIDAYLAAKVGDLDEEIRVAKAYLAWAIEQHQGDPLGGIQYSFGRVQSWRSWETIVGEHQDKVRKLELARSKIAKTGDIEAAKSAVLQLMAAIKRGEFDDGV